MKMENTIKPISKKKQLGQYFTPKHVIQFLLSGLKTPPNSILDPMAGNGSFLNECYLKFPTAKIVGIELDKNQIYDNASIKFFHDDIFSWAKNQIKENKFQQFSAIVGNPAYINYQNLNNLTNSENDYKSFLLETMKEIADYTHESSKLYDVFRLWSKLGDLNAYTLILSWLLTKSGGTIAIVMSNHWMERDYGKIIRHFLSSTGTFRAIITHRKGNWFPDAQIPTSILIYEKGKISNRQKSLGVPFVEIDAPYTENIEKFVKSTSKNFWKWIDTEKKPTKFNSLQLSFKKWLLDSNELKNITKSKKIPPLLELPSFLHKENYEMLNELGWKVHQGLRTGCNEVFYVQKIGKEEYLSIITEKKQKIERKLHIPSSFLIPCIRKLSRKNHLIQNSNNTDFFVLNLSHAILSNDKSIFHNYPNDWKKKWKYDKFHSMPNDLEEFLSECEFMPYEKASSGKIVKELSAVKSNIYLPSKNSKEIPNSPRFWYQLSFQKRHFGEIITPRVSNSSVPSILINSNKKLAIDANFLTYVSTEPSLDKEKLWIWLNSNTFRIICEINGVKLGGGALKLEASLLSQIPVPKLLNQIPISQLKELKKLLTNSQVIHTALLETGMKIDSIIFNDKISKSNFNLLKSLIEKRVTH